MSRTLGKLLGSSRRKRRWTAFRIAVVVGGGAVVVVVASIKPTAGVVGLGVATIVLAIVSPYVVWGITEGVNAVYRHTVGGARSDVARLVVRGAAPVTGEPGSPAANLAAYLGARLAGTRAGGPIVIATGSDGPQLAAVVEDACAALSPEVQVIAPLEDELEDIEALAEWLVDGADEKRLPAKSERNEPTLFLLGDLERYRGTGLESSSFDVWRNAPAPRLALATDVTRSRGDEWSDELYGTAHAMSVLGGSASGRRAVV
jgi:hypothetical protein